MKKNKKNLNWIYILGFVLLLIFVAMYVMVNSAASKVLEYTELNASVKVGDYVGINLDTDKIHFGTVSEGGYSKRDILIKSDYEGTIYFVTTEPLHKWIFYSEFQDLTILPGENKTVTLYVAPKGAEEGIYEAPVGIYILKKEPGGTDEFFLKWKEMDSRDPTRIIQPKVSINIVRPDENVSKV